MRLRARTLHRNRGRGRRRRSVDHQFVAWSRTHSGWLVRTRLMRRLCSVRFRVGMAFRRHDCIVLRMGRFRGRLVRLMRRLVLPLMLGHFRSPRLMRGRLRLRPMRCGWRCGPRRHCSRREPSCRHHNHHCPHAAPPSMSRCFPDPTGRRLYPTRIGQIRLRTREQSGQRHLRSVHGARRLHGDRPMPRRHRLDHRQASFGNERAGVNEHLRADLA